eukprot:9328689-Pyramimonas_sp.AAC.1
MSYTIARGGVTYRGYEIMALPAVPADAAAGTPEDYSGIRQFLDTLKTVYELHDQDRVGMVLDAYFDCTRGNSELTNWIAQCEMAYDDACEEDALQMNMVGTSHFLLKNSDLSEKRIDDIKLHVGGDLAQYQAIRGQLMRLGKQDQSQHHQDWALYTDQNGHAYDRTEYHEILYEACDATDYEWGWTEDEGWSATLDGE